MFENVKKIFIHFNEKYAFVFVLESKGYKQVFFSFHKRPRTVEDIFNPENWSFTDESIVLHDDVYKAIAYAERRGI